MGKHTADIYKSFSNKNRLQLLACLTTPKSVSELLEYCDLSQSALSQHLKVLRDSGVVVCTREGKMQIYKVARRKMITLAQQLLQLEK